MQQLWAQVYEEMFKGKDSPQWWLTDNEQIQLEKLNAHHKKRTVIEDLLESELNFDAPIGSWIQLSAIDLLRAVGMEKPTNQQAKECTNFLRQRLEQPTRSQGKTRWKVPPINGTFQLPKTPQHDDDEDDDKY